ncbi:MAG: F-box protein [Proteobacteria bacterium]|nr:F-box protein [Pseudomonadota bacterium]
MFKKNFLKSAALMGVSLLASVCAHATHQGDPMDEDDAQTSPIAALPNEVLDQILSCLSLTGMLGAGHVCKLWNEITNDLATAPNGRAPLSSILFDPNPASKAYEISHKDMAITLFFHIKRSGFAPLENVFISPDLYPQGTHLLNYKDLEAHPDTVSAWYTALFGNAPQDAHALALVMAALPPVLVEDQTSQETLGRITSYIDKVGKSTRFASFTCDENQEELETLKGAPHTFVVRAHDLHANKDTLAALLDTRNDHHVVLSLDTDAYIQDGVLTMSKRDIPEKLCHLTLSDPFGKVTAIGDFFLACAPNLESLYMRNLTHLIVIKNSFLFGTKNLKSFGTQGLISLKTIGNGFLWNRKGLESFDARGLSRLTTIGNDFLRNTNLTLFSTEPLTHVEQVGNNFLTDTKLCAQEQEKVDAFLTRVRQKTAAGA